MVNHIARYRVVGESTRRSILHNINGELVTDHSLLVIPNVRGLTLNSSHVLEVGRLDDTDRQMLSTNALHCVGLALNAKSMSLITLLSKVARGERHE